MLLTVRVQPDIRHIEFQARFMELNDYGFKWPLIAWRHMFLEAESMPVTLSAVAYYAAHLSEVAPPQNECCVTTEYLHCNTAIYILLRTNG